VSTHTDDGPGGPRRQDSRLPRRASAGIVRRRRTVAGTGVLVVLVVVVLALSAGGAGIHGKRSRAPAPVGLLTRVRMLAGSGPQSFSGDELRSENAAIDRAMSYTPYVRIAGSQHRELALTFDDGPGPYTPEVLRILQREHVPGTFFEVGTEEQYFHASTTQIVRDGFPIGDHTENHDPMSGLSKANQRLQLMEQAVAIGRYGAPFPRLFRPPYGVWNDTTLSLLAKYHMLMTLWTVDTDDYELPGVQAIVESAVRGSRPGAIILLHDAGGDRSETVAALPIIIRELRRRGYKLVTVPQLLLDNPPPRDQNIVGFTGAGG
jgi:peptidoglycan/xylan/chitin deacetylase (PgdA/CDA1 family)